MKNILEKINHLIKERIKLVIWKTRSQKTKAAKRKKRTFKDEDCLGDIWDNTKH